MKLVTNWRILNVELESSNHSVTFQTLEPRENPPQSSRSSVNVNAVDITPCCTQVSVVGVAMHLTCRRDQTARWVESRIRSWGGSGSFRSHFYSINNLSMRGKKVGGVEGWALPLLIAARFKMSHFVNVICFSPPPPPASPLKKGLVSK
jgi:hypothetical protein